MAALLVAGLLALARTAACLQTVTQDGSLHNLTVCNAYADSRPMNVYSRARGSRGQEERDRAHVKLTEQPLEYKRCRSLVVDLAEDAHIDFRLGGFSVGTFHANNLPYASASLLLVPYHHTNGSMSADFLSHTFPPDEEGSQIAVLDTYTGSARGTMHILSGGPSPAAVELHGTAAVQLHAEGAEGKRRRTAELKPSTAATLAAGQYEVVLRDASGNRQRTVSLDAAAGSTFVVIRVGSEEDDLAQDLLVAKISGSSGAAGSGTVRLAPGALAGVLAACAAVSAGLP
ncbi:unnamed protein product [Prorocentrum cordatum]|uniref:Uncharacterized protein n=1 Tax=Prorocentrum cordatum TaxID=2364126 RepID=A0ABN9SEK7_9DINO|nr:unnamed protein product [Polarella glacialis]|mmetsp:Transcript_18931/g.53600  ORF Transcript_18931/g.53600 Transcript_18931/m.53600 type:complete len:287 (+) Transcript_18931:89-949(+)